MKLLTRQTSSSCSVLSVLSQCQLLLVQRWTSTSRHTASSLTNTVQARQRLSSLRCTQITLRLLLAFLSHLAALRLTWIQLRTLRDSVDLWQRLRLLTIQNSSVSWLMTLMVSTPSVRLPTNGSTVKVHILAQRTHTARIAAQKNCYAMQTSSVAGLSLTHSWVKSMRTRFRTESYLMMTHAWICSTQPNNYGLVSKQRVTLIGIQSTSLQTVVSMSAVH